MESRMRVFVSYAHDDQAQVKDWIIEPIDGPYKVWFDEHIPGGAVWRQTIQREIKACDVFLYVLSPESVRSRYCREEFRQAQNLGKRILPVLLQNRTKIPEAIAVHQYVDFRAGTSAASVSALLEALVNLERELKPSSSPPPAPVSPTSTSRKRDWNVIFAGLSVVIAIIGILVTLQSTQQTTIPATITQPPTLVPATATTALAAPLAPISTPRVETQSLRITARDCPSSLEVSAALRDAETRLESAGIGMRRIDGADAGVEIALDCQPNEDTANRFTFLLDGLTGTTPDGDAVSIAWLQPINFRLWGLMIEPPPRIALTWTHAERVEDLGRLAFALAAYANARAATQADPLRLAAERLDSLSTTLRSARDPVVCLLEGNLHLRRALTLDFDDPQMNLRVQESLADAASAYEHCLSSIDPGDAYHAALANNAGLVAFLAEDAEAAERLFQQADFTQAVVDYAAINRSMMFVSRGDDAAADQACPDNPTYALGSLCRAQPVYGLASMSGAADQFARLDAEIADAVGGIMLGIEAPQLGFYRAASALCGQQDADTAAQMLADVVGAAARQPLGDPVFDALIAAHIAGLVDQAICDPFESSLAM